MNIIETTRAYSKVQKSLSSHMKHIESIIRDSNEKLEGNAFYTHETMNLRPELRNKQFNIFGLGGLIKTRVCEIGFNAGHSSLLMLLGRAVESFDFTIFDIGEHKYMLPSFNYITSQFPDIRFELIIGDSTVEIPRWIENNKTLCESYDVVHIDGGHSEHCISNDFINADKLVSLGGIIIIDDTQSGIINSYVDRYIDTGRYSEVAVFPTTGYKHRVIKRIQ